MTKISCKRNKEDEVPFNQLIMLCL